MTELQGGERLQKVLAHAGVGSRRAVEEMIVSGRIRVNGKRAELGRRVDPAKDKVEVDGSIVPLRTDLVYYLLNKPEGVVTTADDPEGRPTVIDVVDAAERVWPVGRLDIGSEGAIILTNDGDLTLRLTHPRYHVPRTYVAQVQGAVGHRILTKLARGIELDDGPTAPARVGLLERVPGGSLVEITITEGRNRQVRRMFEAVGHPVTRLVRRAIGPLELGRLKPGDYRRLSPVEVQSLYRASDTK
ncbi:MAG: rRNA pseudouridine synthase [Actinomycetota bacterium]|nr:rRNA pseudouridine synthase [Actinomycetota bacterium]